MTIESENAHEEVKEIVEKCIRCGRCNLFCPVLKVMKEEAYSPRGQVIMLDDNYFDPPEPETASDIDITIKTSRNTTSDYLQFAFEKLWSIDQGDIDFSFQDYYLMGNVTYILKPTTYETGAKLTITEVNALDDDFYEG